MKRIASIIAIILALPLLCAAQIKVEVQPVVQMGDQFKIVFTMNEKPSSFEWEPSESFKLVWGPQQGSSTSISMINGKTTRQSTYTYTYIIIAQQEGTWTLPAARAVVSGNTVISKTSTVEVVAGVPAVQDNSQGTSSSQSQTRRGSPAPSTYLKLTLAKSTLRVGEPVTASLKLYTNEAITGFEDARFPTFQGFWSESTYSPTNIEFTKENVGGQVFDTALLRQWTLIPQQSGILHVEQAEIICLVREAVSSGDPFFDGFFDNYRTNRKRLMTKDMDIKVSPLPANAPASFNGAVGNYKIDAYLVSDSLKMHDSASLIVKISGTGNVTMLSAPKVNFPPDSEVYDTKVTDNTAKGISGSKTFEYPFIPRSYGDFEIAPVEFSYYDPSTGRYVTIASKALPYHVAKSNLASGVTAEGTVVGVPGVHRKEVETLGMDIRYISTRMPHLHHGMNFLVWSPLFFAALMCMICLAGCIAVYVIVSRKRRADMVGSRKRGASKLAIRRLSLAKNFLQKGQQAPYYEELHKALLGYVADKLNIGGADLAKESIAAMLAVRGVKEDVVSEYIGLLDQCEFARYAPESGDTMMKETYEKALAVISALESQMKKTGSGKGAAMASIVALMMFGLGVAAPSVDAHDAAGLDSLWTAAVIEYAQGDYEAACGDFTGIYLHGVSSAELLTNIADCHFKNGELGQAILFYERALKLDPSNADARYNLGVAQGSVRDKIESVPELYIKQFFRKLCYSLTSNTWTVIFLVLFGLFLACVLVYFLSESKPWRITGFFSGIVALLVAVWCLCNASYQRSAALSDDSGVMTCSVSVVNSAPAVGAGNALFEIHEGTKVHIIETLGEWTRISIADGREGWVLTSNLTVI